MITGCERVSYLALEPIKGFLQTPEGKFEFRTITKAEAVDFGLYDSRYSSHRYLLSDGKDIKIFLSYVNDLKLIVASSQKKITLMSQPEDTYYQANNGDKQPSYYKLHPDTPTHFLLKGYLFQDERKVNFYSGIIALLTPKGKLKTRDTYKYHVPFKLDGVSCLVDLTFELKNKKRFQASFGVPGTP